MAKGRDLSQLSVVADVLEATFEAIALLLAQFGLQGESHYNICLTDGYRILACRYCTNLNVNPESMHYAIGSRFGKKNQQYHMLKEEGSQNCVLISSERLTNEETDWQTVPANHMMLVDAGASVQFRSLCG